MVAGYLEMVWNLFKFCILGGERMKKSRFRKYLDRNFMLIKIGINDLRGIVLIFLQPILIFILLLIVYVVSILGMNFNTYTAILIIFVYFTLTHKLVESFLIKLYEYVDKTIERKPNRLTALLGIIDRLVYALCFAIHQYNFIGIWLGIKIVQRVTQFKSVTIDEHDKIRIIGERKNIFLIANLVSLVLGIMGGYLIQILFNLPLSVFPKN